MNRTPGPARTDLTHQTFGCLYVLRLDYVSGGHGHWLCECRRPRQDGKLCGVQTVVRDTKLRTLAIVSCGCERADPEVRRTARLKTPERRRKQIARLGAKASKAARTTG